MNVSGISFPGHFLVGVEEDDEPLLIDVFAGRIVSRDDCYQLIEKMYQRKISPDNSYFVPATNRRIVLRLLENLKAIYLKGGLGTEALTCLDCQLMIMPDHESFLEQQQGVLAHLQKRDGDNAPPVH
jgi:regulator of sirC expression with transglutaminase-like and TPR domain